MLFRSGRQGTASYSPDEAGTDLTPLFETIEDLRASKLADEIPPHGMLARTRQHIPEDRRAGNALPTGVPEPVWLARNDEGAES